MIDWDGFRKCPVCQSPTGTPCYAMNGRVAGGRPDGQLAVLPAAHSSRQPRRGRRRHQPRSDGAVRQRPDR